MCDYYEKMSIERVPVSKSPIDEIDLGKLISKVAVELEADLDLNIIAAENLVLYNGLIEVAKVLYTKDYKNVVINEPSYEFIQGAAVALAIVDDMARCLNIDPDNYRVGVYGTQEVRDVVLDRYGQDTLRNNLRAMITRCFMSNTEPQEIWNALSVRLAEIQMRRLKLSSYEAHEGFVLVYTLARDAVVLLCERTQLVNGLELLKGDDAAFNSALKELLEEP